MRNRWIRGKQLNRLTEHAKNAMELDQDWCDKWLAVIELRKKGLAKAIRHHWERGGQVLEYGFAGTITDRKPFHYPDTYLDADQLSELLANRCQGFLLSIELVNLGPFPCCGSD